MAFYFALNAQESSVLLTSRPSADSIWNALQTVTLPQATRWVSPLARITRTNSASFRPWKTDVTWVLEVDGPYSPDMARSLANQAAASIDAVLAPLSSDWSKTTVDPYAEAQYGPLSAWVSGQAATPRYDHTAIAQAEDGVRQAEQFGADAAEVARRAAAATGQYVEQAGGRVGSILGTTVASALKPIPSTTLLLIGAGLLVGGFVVVKIWKQV